MRRRSEFGDGHNYARPMAGVSGLGLSAKTLLDVSQYMGSRNEDQTNPSENPPQLVSATPLLVLSPNGNEAYFLITITDLKTSLQRTVTLNELRQISYEHTVGPWMLMDKQASFIQTASTAPTVFPTDKELFNFFAQERIDVNTLTRMSDERSRLTSDVDGNPVILSRDNRFDQMIKGQTICTWLDGHQVHLPGYADPALDGSVATVFEKGDGSQWLSLYQLEKELDQPIATWQLTENQEFNSLFSSAELVVGTTVFGEVLVFTPDSDLPQTITPPGALAFPIGVSGHKIIFQVSQDQPATFISPYFEELQSFDTETQTFELVTQIPDEMNAVMIDPVHHLAIISFPGSTNVMLVDLETKATTVHHLDDPLSTLRVVGDFYISDMTEHTPTFTSADLLSSSFLLLLTLFFWLQRARD